MKDFLGNEFHPVEMYKLINMLIQDGSHKFTVEEFMDTPCVRFQDDAGHDIGDAICHSGSYGHENGLLEIMGLGICVKNDGDDVKGWMTAEEVIQQLKKFITQRKDGLTND